MQRWQGLGDIPDDWARCVLTIGVFDGLHRGHAAVLRRTVDEARARSVAAVLMMTDPDRTGVGHPGDQRPRLSSPKRCAALSEALGIDVLARMPPAGDQPSPVPETTLSDIFRRLRPVTLVIGANAAAGPTDAGLTLPLVRRIAGQVGSGVTVVDLVETDGKPCSSSRIHSLLDRGEVAAAANTLGRPHRVEGVVTRGEGRGRRLGFPTANLSWSDAAAIPADGIYAAWFTVLDSAPVSGTIRPGVRYPSVASVGDNPTFAGKTRTVEPFVLDQNADLYGRHVAVDFVERIRGMVKFDSVAALIDTMHDDTARCRKILTDTGLP
jgi:riboflavin kinase/FMN adenylyltransferase